MPLASLQSSPLSTWPSVILHLLCATFVLFWLGRVNSVVPEPYLDEVFHVRQAQTYWAGHWLAWDPKITTPPGLYIWSYALAGVPRFLGLDFELNAAVVRTTNAFASVALLPACLVKLLLLIHRDQSAAHVKNEESKDSASFIDWRLVHVTLNIFLFPPLFFFSGLYYTDLLSALMVLEAYHAYYQSSCGGNDKNSSKISVDAPALAGSSVRLWLYGLLSLCFRQTNIFWVSAFLGGLQVVQILRVTSKEIRSSSSTWDIASGSWSDWKLYDPPIAVAALEDYLKAGLSLALACPSRLLLIAPRLLPYVSFLVAFGAFVYWNGSVVLGHKEFHTASLHLPQMLYIWPYITFFSWPLMSPYLLNSIFPQRLLPRFLQNETSRRSLPRLVVTVPIVLAMIFIVRFNMIIHPFTLADNRHYVFYVFRILRRHAAIKYAAVLIYLICGWLVIMTLSDTQQQLGMTEGGKPKARKGKRKDDNPASLGPDSTEGNRASFLIIWLIATTLSLITAPLVEPRYFIIPWIIWRLHVPLKESVSSPQNAGLRDTPTRSEQLKKRILGYDHRLWVETIWYLAVNATTGYMFLYKGFSWRQEPESVQRFLW